MSKKKDVTQTDCMQERLLLETVARAIHVTNVTMSNFPLSSPGHGTREKFNNAKVISAAIKERYLDPAIAEYSNSFADSGLFNIAVSIPVKLKPTMRGFSWYPNDNLFISQEALSEEMTGTITIVSNPHEYGTRRDIGRGCQVSPIIVKAIPWRINETCGRSYLNSLLTVSGIGEGDGQNVVLHSMDSIGNAVSPQTVSTLLATLIWSEKDPFAANCPIPQLTPVYKALSRLRSDLCATPEIAASCDPVPYLDDKTVMAMSNIGKSMLEFSPWSHGRKFREIMGGEGFGAANMAIIQKTFDQTAAFRQYTDGRCVIDIKRRRGVEFDTKLWTGIENTVFSGDIYNIANYCGVKSGSISVDLESDKEMRRFLWFIYVAAHYNGVRGKNLMEIFATSPFTEMAAVERLTSAIMRVFSVELLLQNI